MVKRNAEGADRSEGGGGIEKAGWYHFMVETAEENQTAAQLKCTVVAGEHDSEVGKKLTHFVNFYASDQHDAKKQETVTRMMFDWAEALMLEEKITSRIFTPEVRKEMAEKSADVELDFAEAMGRQFCAKVVIEPYKGNDAEKKAKYAGRQFARISFDVFHPLHDKCKSCPKDPELISYLGGPKQGGNGSAAKKKPTPPAPLDNVATPGGAPVAAASSDPWSTF